jgi:hypothetical protein
MVAVAIVGAKKATNTTNIKEKRFIITPDCSCQPGLKSTGFKNEKKVVLLHVTG